ncbi:hypothetical protein SAMN05661080_02910 [Modestobacter sp. DSM 44400]|uniref:hypothetical protein n=1 Tax=Modestobacter sp. DSM 44400 TaxID=1550230 RepID=UPI00089C07F5|nr:hypothetical protein [Modestobacter sp. DSM 44400]SDY27419.1 hypothetical protein SAMN05661080_02910 [Modestobacter sp. DSM 44400]
MTTKTATGLHAQFRSFIEQHCLPGRHDLDAMVEHYVSRHGQESLSELDPAQVHWFVYNHQLSPEVTPGCPSFCGKPAGHPYEASDWDGTWSRYHTPPLPEDVARYVSIAATETQATDGTVTVGPLVATVEEADNLDDHTVRRMAYALLTAATRMREDATGQTVTACTNCGAPVHVGTACGLCHYDALPEGDAR